MHELWRKKERNNPQQISND